MSAIIEPEIIRASPSCYVAQSAFFSMPLAFMLFLDIKDGFAAYPTFLLALVFIPCMALFLWRALHPPVLRLDQKGFTYPGGFARPARTVRWMDVTEFAVYTRMTSRGRGFALPRITYFLRPDADIKFSPFELSFWSAQKILPSFYVSNTEQLVDQLTTYRQRALS